MNLTMNSAALVGFVNDVYEHIDEVDQSTVIGRQFVKMFSWNVLNGKTIEAAELAIRYIRSSQ